ncbi:MAG: hypothetical protein R3C09_05715 [Pirellulaceae bacterium]
MRHAKAAGQNEPTSNDGEHHSMIQSLGPRPQGDADSPKRILYDMSFTCLSGKISGIERVVQPGYRWRGVAAQTLTHPPRSHSSLSLPMKDGSTSSMNVHSPC